MTVVPIKRGTSIASDAERQFVEELGVKVRAHVETHGHIPDLAVLCLYGEGRDGKAWGVGYFSPEPRGAIEAYGIAMAAITKTLR